MRVITGKARGMRLRTLEGNAVRPTSEKVKEAVFSMLQFDIEGRRVLDLFAGCGQMGIEALSRGAKSVTFVDSSAESIKTIKDNLTATKLSDGATVEKRDFKFFLSSCREQFDIAFLDPPYHDGFYDDALSLLSPLMSSYGIIVCEHPSDVSVPEEIDDFHIAKESRYGKICISVYRRKEA
ncbi:MAG: 16S rRNA (guanine(966)-N(2))-methyltransferase RsmD [Clostridia bacterium]|nr:16S rRNA (guanine(966)-N(2))-methyltransferase RsmD [Clostridia bacterium]